MADQIPTLPPTPSRIALMRAVADGAVTERYPLRLADSWTELDLVGAGLPAPGVRFRKVSGAVEALRSAGLVRLGSRVDAVYNSPRLWELTDAGRMWLEVCR